MQSVECSSNGSAAEAFLSAPFPERLLDQGDNLLPPSKIDLENVEQYQERMLLAMTESADSANAAVVALRSVAYCARVTKAALRTVSALYDSNAFLTSRRGLHDFQKLGPGYALLEEGDLNQK
jgi:hypothetical protein